MKYKAIILLVIPIMIFVHSVSAAEESEAIIKLNHLADQALQQAKFGQMEEAKQSLLQFGRLFSEEGLDSQTFSMDELRIVTTTHHQALNALNAVKQDPSETIRRLTAFRLATDAVTSEHQPLWSEMEKPILSAFQQVKNAALEGDADLYNQELNNFLSTYSIIQPSIKIDLPVETVQSLDSKMSYMDQYRTRFSEHKWLRELDAIEIDLKGIFDHVNKSNTDPSVWWVIIMTGGIIISTLTYVSWRKYKGHKNVIKKKRSK